MEWSDAERVIQSGARWERYTEMRMGAGADMSVVRVQDDRGRTVYRAEAAWDNWTLFKIVGDYESVSAALSAVDIFAVALTDLLGKKGAGEGLISGAGESR